MGKNDDAWQQIFKRFDILGQVDKFGVFYITAEEIKQYREPRLMVKFDCFANLPHIFQNADLSILPVTRGSYAIGRFNAYHTFEKPVSDVKQMLLPAHLESLNLSGVTSEAKALNAAYAAGIIEDFIEDYVTFPTVSGRMGSGDFSFTVETRDFKPLNLDVNASQIEIDAAYEGRKFLSLIEAKNVLSEDFIIRQLYYPFRVFAERVKKPVKSIFLVYSNGIYKLYEYAFDDFKCYNSLSLVKQQNYAIDDIKITLADIKYIWENSSQLPEPEGVPFPQADDFSRVINLCEILEVDELTEEELAEQYNFVSRQAGYYTNAALYLGLVEFRKIGGKRYYRASEQAKSVLKKDFKQRQLDYCEKILTHRVFRESLKIYFESGKIPTKDEIVPIMHKYGVAGVASDSTFKRRAQTVYKWVEWIVSLTWSV